MNDVIILKNIKHRKSKMTSRKMLITYMYTDYACWGQRWNSQIQFEFEGSLNVWLFTVVDFSLILGFRVPWV